MSIAIDCDLDLDVAVLVEPFLEVERVVAERGLGLAAAHLEHRFELARRAHHAHALAAAAGRWLDQHRIADPLGLGQRVLVVAEHPVRARDRRQAVGAQQLARAGLAGESLEDVGRRADERQAMGRDDFGEALVLGQEAVARMDRIAPGDECRRDDRRTPRGTNAAPRPGRCRWPRPRDRQGATRGRLRCTRRRTRPRGHGTRAGCGARSRPGWRSGPSGTSERAHRGGSDEAGGHRW